MGSSSLEGTTWGPAPARAHILDSGVGSPWLTLDVSGAPVLGPQRPLLPVAAQRQESQRERGVVSMGAGGIC